MAFTKTPHFVLIFRILFSTTVSSAALNGDWAQRRIDTSEAWRLSRGSSNIVIAVIDTGVDRNHPALKGKLWDNPGETGLDRFGRDKATNGIDDDGNGYVDDAHGWDFATQSRDLNDRHGHGTHIAGILAAEPTRQAPGGIAPQSRLMILKYYEPGAAPIENLKNTIEAFRYAIRMGARIINYSGGGTESSAEERAVIREAGEAGILVVAAAGNEKTNTDAQGFFPAAYNLPNILSVAAVDENDRLVDSSNYGRRVLLAAPGKNILSTAAGGGYEPMTGTSQATAFVSGAAALLLSRHPEWRDPAALIRRLCASGDFVANLQGQTAFQSRLNVYRALIQEDQGAASIDDAFADDILMGQGPVPSEIRKETRRPSSPSRSSLNLKKPNSH